MTTKNITTDETAARAYFEGVRWPNGPFCPHCGCTDKVYRLEGKSHRPGLFHCNACSGQFTVTTGTVMESSHIPLHKWAMGFQFYAASKKGFSAHQLHRMLGITYKSAWFMAHRIREAMDTKPTEPMGSGGGTVEADETYIGQRESAKKKRGGFGHKIPVVSLVERKGSVRSF
ncbi:MAG: IS1595 family transposase, partial [Gemmataceae bacterium]